MCNESKICEISKNLIKSLDIFSKKALKRKPTRKKCESCEENDAIFCCLGCSQQSYCNDCLKLHQKNKKFVLHKLISLEEADFFNKKNSEHFCSCELRKKIDYFCENCQIGICRFCSKTEEHQNHGQINLNEIFFHFTF